MNCPHNIKRHARQYLTSILFVWRGNNLFAQFHIIRPLFSHVKRALKPAARKKECTETWRPRASLCRYNWFSKGKSAKGTRRGDARDHFIHAADIRVFSLPI